MQLGRGLNARVKMLSACCSMRGTLMFLQHCLAKHVHHRWTILTTLETCLNKRLPVRQQT